MGTAYEQMIRESRERGLNLLARKRQGATLHQLAIAEGVSLTRIKQILARAQQLEMAEAA